VCSTAAEKPLSWDGQKLYVQNIDQKVEAISQGSG
jgi:hypothetical protein